jgi:aromatase
MAEQRWEAPSPLSPDRRPITEDQAAHRSEHRVETEELAGQDTSSSTRWESEAVVIFSDSIVVPASLDFAYECLWDVARWPELLSHVNEVRMVEEHSGYQRFTMETTGPAGTHVTESIRYSGPDHVITYEQVGPPPLLRVHTGRWLFEPVPDGVRIIGEHTIEIRPERIVGALGRVYSVRDAGLLARHMIGNHSVATLKTIKERAEALSTIGEGQK